MTMRYVLAMTAPIFLTIDGNVFLQSVVRDSFFWKHFAFGLAVSFQASRPNSDKTNTIPMRLKPVIISPVHLIGREKTAESAP